MTQLRIEQSSSTIETVSESVIEKLYDVAIEIDEPGSGEDDDAYVSGHISLPYSYRMYVEYLAGSIGEGTSGVVTSLRQNAEGRFQDLRIDVTNGYYAYFEDPNVRTIITNNYGTLYESQLTSITDISNIFSGTNIETFNELSQTGVTTLAWDAFKNCSHLKHVNVSNITDVNYTGGSNICHTFYGCSIEELDFSSLQFAVFRFSSDGSIVCNCSSLKSINMPEYLGSDRYSYENNYNNHYWSPQITNPFYGCTSLEYINFGKCEDLKFEDPDQYHAGAFQDLPSLKIVECGYHLTSLGTYSFKNTPNLKAIVIRNTTTVPTINWRNRAQSIANLCGGSTNCIIYVPQQMISTYQADSNWIALSSNIQAIENYNKDAILASN